MKTIWAILILMGASALARAGDVKVEVVVAQDGASAAATSFTSDTLQLLAIFKTTGARSGDQLRGVWIAEDVGAAAPKETKINETTVTADGDTADGEFNLSKPTNGWPVGKYRMEIYVNGKLAATARFTVKPK